MAADRPGPKLAGVAGRSGLAAYQAGYWGVMSAIVDNPTDQPVNVLTAISFDKQTDVQFGTDSWLPSKSRRIVVQPVRIPDPELLGDKPNRAEATIHLLDTSTTPDRQWGYDVALIGVEMQQPISGMIAGTDDDRRTDVAIAARVAAVSNQRFTFCRWEQVPSQTAAINSVDTLVISDSEANFDPAQIESLRNWVMSGGRIWIMLDSASPKIAQRILRNDWTVNVVDRVQLNHVAFTDAAGKTGATADYETAVDLVRVQAPGMDVLYRVNGWPVAMSRPVGRGSVMVTTLGPEAWLNSDNTANEALERIGVAVMKARYEPPVTGQQFNSYLSHQIGFSIMSRNPVVAILGALVVGLLVAGLVLRRLNRQELIGWVGVGMSVAATLALVLLGRVQRDVVPLTVSSAQFVRIVPEQKQAIVNGLVSVYSPVADKGPIEAVKGGIAWPDMSGQEGQLLRMVWTDWDKWQWRNLKLPSGAIRSADFYHAIPLSDRPEATIRFTPEGVAGEIHGLKDSGSLSDMVLASPRGHLLPKVLPDGSFAAPANDPTAENLFVMAGTDAREIERGNIYRNLLTNRYAPRALAIHAAASGTLAAPAANEAFSAMRLSSRNYPDRLVLLSWGEPLDLGIQLVQTSVIKNSALLEIPVRIQKAKTGDKVSVPSLFLPFRDAKRGPGSNNDPMSGQWGEPLINADEKRFAFEVPREILPLKLDSSSLTIDIRAPGRTVTVVGYNGRQEIPIDARSAPMSPYTVDLAAANVPVEANGDIRISIKIGDYPDMDNPKEWNFNSLKLQINGTVGGQP